MRRWTKTTATTRSVPWPHRSSRRRRPRTEPGVGMQWKARLAGPSAFAAAHPDLRSRREVFAVLVVVPIPVPDVVKRAGIEDVPAYYRTRSTYSSRSEEHTSELQSLMRISYAVFCLK